MNIFKIYITVLHIAIWLGLVDGAIGFVTKMRDEALHAHTHHQISRSRFTRMMTDQKGVGSNVRKHSGKKR